MGMIDHASANTDQADLVILNNVETIKDQMQPATASAVASLIGGAPVNEVYRRLVRLKALQILELDGTYAASFQLTELGVELMRREFHGWSPSEREDRRRAEKLARARANGWRSL